MSDKAAKLQPLFDLIDEAGGPKLPNYNSKSFNFSKKSKVIINYWAFFFTIFYYLYHGMWKKGIVLLVISIVLGLLAEKFIPALSVIPWIFSSAIFGTQANVDLYKKYKLSGADPLAQKAPNQSGITVAASAPVPAPVSTQGEVDFDKLEKLSQLHKSGVLSDEEFATQKAKVLGA